MEMFYLMLKIGYGLTVIPSPYKLEQCFKLSDEYNKQYGVSAYCIPAPISNLPAYTPSQQQFTGAK